MAWFWTSDSHLPPPSSNMTAFQAFSNWATFMAICNVPGPDDHDLQHFWWKYIVCFWFSAKMSHSKQWVSLTTKRLLNNCHKKKSLKIRSVARLHYSCKSRTIIICVSTVIHEKSPLHKKIFPHLFANQWCYILIWFWVCNLLIHSKATDSNL